MLTVRAQSFQFAGLGQHCRRLVVISLQFTHVLSDQPGANVPVTGGGRHLLKVALGDHALALRNDVEIGFVPPAMAHGNGGQVAGLVGPRLTCGPTPPA